MTDKEQLQAFVTLAKEGKMEEAYAVMPLPEKEDQGDLAIYDVHIYFNVKGHVSKLEETFKDFGLKGLQCATPEISDAWAIKLSGTPLIAVPLIVKQLLGKVVDNKGGLDVKATSLDKVITGTNVEIYK
jgi:hypothetical protein